MSKYPYGLEVLTRKKQIKKGDYTYTLLGADTTSHVLIDNHRTKKQGVCVPMSAILELFKEDK